MQRSLPDEARRADYLFPCLLSSSEEDSEEDGKGGEDDGTNDSAWSCAAAALDAEFIF